MRPEFIIFLVSYLTLTVVPDYMIALGITVFAKDIPIVTEAATVLEQRLRNYYHQLKNELSHYQNSEAHD